MNQGRIQDFKLGGGGRTWIRPCERYKFTYLLVRELRKQVTLNECHLRICLRLLINLAITLKYNIIITYF
jgi:hypothetical protein